MCANHKSYMIYWLIWRGEQDGYRVWLAHAHMCMCAGFTAWSQPPDPNLQEAQSLVLPPLLCKLHSGPHQLA